MQSLVLPLEKEGSRDAQVDLSLSWAHMSGGKTANTQRSNNVITTSLQRRDVAVML